MKRILIVDDEQDICEILQFNLENAGYLVESSNSAEQALKQLVDKTKAYDLLILDVMMGGMSGYQLARKIRTEMDSKLPIVFLTAKSTENDLLTGFSLGGDDYIAKPFSIQEVLARIKAIFRRSESNMPPRQDELLQSEGLILNPKAKTASLDGEILTLTKKEFQILDMLMKASDSYFTREQILDRIWGDESFVLERTVDVHIARLRKKLGTRGEHLQSRPGFGYCWLS
ncbi:MAG: response regulator transcription factor [Bacteroidales bacterium]|jgi:two-component system alkaline phosphatase synthesis response regulator PhoP|nr:response regulator transcription factor [Bacteroidales bacterium]MDD4640812.1 response regulator transcription factor [Bacteroidales bacterium]